MYLRRGLSFLLCAAAAATGHQPRGSVSTGPKAQNVLGGGESARAHRPVASSRARTGFVALGDSYSAGIGTGFEGKEDDCRLGLHAHPRLIASDLAASQGGPNATSFQFLSCTGATTADLLSGGEASQIDAFNTSLPADFALLSLGGNDLGFFGIMNACVFRFYSFYSGTCEEELRHAREHIAGEEFEYRLELVIMEILDRARWEKKPWFLVTVTGYARFFNDVTDDCDEMSFGVWWLGPKLKKSLRLQMNALVFAVNAKIKSAVNRVNSKFTKDRVLFVDYDSEFEGHRFCEENVIEPDYNRNDTFFFLVGGRDHARNGTQLKQSTVVETLPPTSALVDPSSCLRPARRSGDWGELALCYMAMAKDQDPSLRPAREDLISQNSMWYVPTYYGKTFHPRSLGHEAIRDKIYEAWSQLDA
ncbi:hypothetical protein DL766_006402 [Monosporascus sp. MC13-8B]|uniref:SGNH hydrolase-type esterase domain-containing protein n=1 Tax=Monosporascus cannonballus TaxID=155416 RepID=A0ABY0H3K2_9PEZI|nr:hypothetical protein DL763_010445 [Monosporascus cannonballus]RYO83281.1 hypothetical protein DL762_006190 [Monosporascus cannonballus]RYP27405.1 hypothetical protein DL766_006402 [Monosporascus sp. MC13-8B]